MTLNFRNATTGAFTLEAMIKFDSSYDPSQPFRNVAPTAAPGTNNGVYPMHLISAEGDGAAAGRPFQFRFDQSGFSAGGNTNPKLEFNNIPVAGNNFFALVPTTGFHAINNTDWFHVAVTYDGLDDTVGNLSFYWTKVDPSVTQANQLGMRTAVRLTPVSTIQRHLLLERSIADFQPCGISDSAASRC